MHNKGIIDISASIAYLIAHLIVAVSLEDIPSVKYCSSHILLLLACQYHKYANYFVQTRSVVNCRGPHCTFISPMYSEVLLPDIVRSRQVYRMRSTFMNRTVPDRGHKP